jgi:protein TonB
MSSLALSANEVFKARYKVYIRNALFAAIFFHFLIFFLSPPFTFKPYTLKEEQFEVVDLPENIEIPPPPQEVALPTVPVEAASDEEADEAEDIAPTTFDDIDDMPPPPPPSSGTVEQFLAFDEPPILIHYEVPKYPDLAREAGIEGTVAIKVLVNEEGKVIDASVLTSDVTPAMERAALDAAMKCRFKPAKQRTAPVKAHVMVPFQFQLRGGG